MNSTPSPRAKGKTWYLASWPALLATPAPPPKRPIGFINPEDTGKKAKARPKG